jgi:ethanolamine utilization protein EutP (predicted NTPase)
MVTRTSKLLLVLLLCDVFLSQVIGIVTRKDLARYRVWRHRGTMGVEELVISEKL